MFFQRLLARFARNTPKKKAPLLHWGKKKDWDYGNWAIFFSCSFLSTFFFAAEFSHFLDKKPFLEKKCFFFNMKKKHTFVYCRI